MIWGIFDSGVGGLTVVRAMRAHHDAARLVYLGDTARVPYGTRSPETVRRYAREAGAFFAGAGVDGVIVACNTASAVALDAFADVFRGPVLGVVEPGVRTALSATRGGRVGVIGTAATIRSDAYGRRLRELRPGVEVVSAACPLFVPLAEEGWTDGEVPRLVARRYLEPLRAAQVDTVILGCTHYPLLKEVVAAEMPGATLVDSADAVSHEAASMRARLDRDAAVRAHALGADRFCVTDAGGSFADVARRILGDRDLTLEPVDLAP